MLSGARLRLEGAVARAIRAGDLANVRAIARLDPTLDRFVRDLERGSATPLTRASVLRGEGWRQLFVELGARCNERCVHCYAESSPERTEELPLSIIERALDDAKELGFKTVQLTGGDPLVASSCVPAARHAARLGFETLEIYTNGLALRGSIFDALCELRASFAFSFYSHDASVHDAITRTPGSQRRTADAIRSVLGAGRSARVGIIVFESNRHDLDRTVAFVRELGVASDAIGIDVQRDVGRGEMIERSLSWSMPETESAGHREGSAGFTGTACIAYDGQVYPCIFSRHLPLGDLRERSLSDVLEDPMPLAPAHDVDVGAYVGRLACVECRIRSALVSGSAPSPIVSLRRARAEGAV